MNVERTHDPHPLDHWRDRIGHEPDRVICEESGYSQSTIYAYRQRHGIVSYQERRRGVIEDTLRRHPETHDGELAAVLGMSVSSVNQIRVSAEIESCSESRSEMKRVDWPTVGHEIAGMSDEDAAEHIGCSPSTVRLYRRHARSVCESSPFADLFAWLTLDAQDAEAIEASHHDEIVALQESHREDIARQVRARRRVQEELETERRTTRRLQAQVDALFAQLESKPVETRTAGAIDARDVCGDRYYHDDTGVCTNGAHRAVTEGWTVSEQDGQTIVTIFNDLGFGVPVVVTDEMREALQ